MSDEQPTMMTGQFDLEDWHFEKFEPGSDSEPREVHIVATNGTQTRRWTVPLFHPNIFGLDVEDAESVNAKVEEAIKELGLE